jgi:hypothetical protein
MGFFFCLFVESDWVALGSKNFSIKIMNLYCKLWWSLHRYLSGLSRISVLNSSTASHLCRWPGGRHYDKTVPTQPYMLFVYSLHHQRTHKVGCVHSVVLPMSSPHYCSCIWNLWVILRKKLKLKVFLAPLSMFSTKHYRIFLYPSNKFPVCVS